ncbi:gamma-glutamylcyclotransferase family protein [Deinococcus radiotolerans]|uniref:Putative gamma-glutamylcyclotransferase n=1 Tax=Deinococcus radiotolerans TaxID=1309407 RepID=A0ABQ2FPP9_9DEIO|nr:gamma-glutamylcyclotransferase family protein [Deinococcus radiotolerans]GGL14665.1 gamma-glutamylcyclotransferase [Deinococcus radiotolerans]
MTDPADVSVTRVFVYGTLLPGERNAHVAARGFTAQAATLRGFTLHHLHPEGYPALTRGPAHGAVRGAVLSYTPQAWAAALPGLDDLEGLHDTPPLYTRELAPLTLDGGEDVTAWVYVYARPDRLRQPGASVVPSGDWRDVPDRGQPGTDGR